MGCRVRKCKNVLSKVQYIYIYITEMPLHTNVLWLQVAVTRNFGKFYDGQTGVTSEINHNIGRLYNSWRVYKLQNKKSREARLLYHLPSSHPYYPGSTMPYNDHCTSYPIIICKTRGPISGDLACHHTYYYTHTSCCFRVGKNFSRLRTPPFRPWSKTKTIFLSCFLFDCNSLYTGSFRDILSGTYRLSDPTGGRNMPFLDQLKIIKFVATHNTTCEMKIIHFLKLCVLHAEYLLYVPNMVAAVNEFSATGANSVLYLQCFSVPPDLVSLKTFWYRLLTD